VTASHELLSQIRYYPRTSTTVLNAYVGPIISRYMTALTRRLQELEFGGLLLIMQSNGGVATPTQVAKRAALSLLSGPAAGPTAGLAHVAPAGIRDCLTVDMGGTSFDVALARDGMPVTMTDGTVAGWPLALPTIDIHTIGAGGGSIARVDKGGLLHVGPESAGADPGPACYGRVAPTLPSRTRISCSGTCQAESPLAGGMRLDRDAAERAIGAIADQLGAGIGVAEAAGGIYDLVNVNMATGVREVTVRRGLDPRDFPVLVAGGAGPVHAAAIATELDVPLLVIPRESSIFCAAGMLMCDFKHDHVRALKGSLNEIPAEDIAAALTEMAAEGRATLVGEGVAAGGDHLRRVDGPAVRRPVARDRRAASLGAGRGPRPGCSHVRVHEEHDRTFGYASQTSIVECLAVRLSAVGATPKPALTQVDEMADDRPEPARIRPAWSPRQRRMVDTPVYSGHGLNPGFEAAGPVIVELATTTIVVLEGFDLIVDPRGAFLLCAGERGRTLAQRLAPALGSAA
jgi:N-methylhydantoinase A